jgi:hypothetical protein
MNIKGPLLLQTKCACRPIHYYQNISFIFYIHFKERFSFCFVHFCLNTLFHLGCSFSFSFSMIVLLSTPKSFTAENKGSRKLFLQNKIVKYFFRQKHLEICFPLFSGAGGWGGGNY